MSALPDATFSDRQNEVLQTALRLLVEGGEKALTTAALARTANCSKESIYKWFGDRDGLLASIVTYQASRVRVIDAAALPKTREQFAEALELFARDLLDVLLSESSLALNRLCVGTVRGDEPGVGAVLLDRGKRRIEDRARRLLEAGRSGGHIAFDDAGAAYRALYGLIIGDLHIRAMLGDGDAVSAISITDQARAAVAQFLTLYAPAGAGGSSQT
ncbi:TetR/AcrR family transcriptional regulator C-terminal domain-containing protein [Tepidamorphus sp. 3E244]|uniref:TetR/AcrR family transcriptional regulator C-terminal domain-containing protein n=1 Tax=Tepidamorphus sp. 3E244 TaxID=3385498 RepID=UPI0038FCA1F9